MSYHATTANLELPQWILSDAPQMADWNAALAKIDTFAGPSGAKGGVARLGNNAAVTPEQGGTGETSLAAGLAALMASVKPVPVTQFAEGVTPSATGGGTASTVVQLFAFGPYVRLRGSVAIEQVTGEYQTLCTLPEGYAPPGTITFLTTCSGSHVARVQINSSGVVTLNWIYNLGSPSIYTGAMNWLNLAAEWNTSQ